MVAQRHGRDKAAAERSIAASAASTCPAWLASYFVGKYFVGKYFVGKYLPASIPKCL
jgi:hypothetical protein